MEFKEKTATIDNIDITVRSENNNLSEIEVTNNKSNNHMVTLEHLGGVDWYLGIYPGTVTIQVYFTSTEVSMSGETRVTDNLGNTPRVWKADKLDIVDQFNSMYSNENYKLDIIKNLVKQWIDKQGHDKCHYYPEIFYTIASTLGLEYNRPISELSPSREEFELGCKNFQDELYGKKEEKEE